MQYVRLDDEQRRMYEVEKMRAFFADFVALVQYGECFYCRDGREQMLVPHRESYVFDGDVVFDKHMVCRDCERWLQHN